ncbi:UNVERIFIED_CONTAM: AAA family ATPase [Actinomycetes bacterium ARC8]|nr:AAA family ATPase [Actinomycetes bacterium ARC8]
MLIDPYRDRVEEHFDYLMDGWCEPLTQRGRVTLALLELNRDELLEKRADALKALILRLQRVGSLHLTANESAELFQPHQPFAGARLNVLRRIMTGLTFQGRPITASVTKLPAFFSLKFLVDIDENRKVRFMQRLEDLPMEDGRRARWNGELGIADIARKTAEQGGSGATWPGVGRNGGLESIRVDRFKGIQTLTLQIPRRKKSKAAPCLVLLGENATGKSSVLQAVALALLGVSQARKLRLEYPELVHQAYEGDYTSGEAGDTSVELEFSTGFKTDYRIDREHHRVGGNQIVSAVVLGYGPRRYFDTKTVRRAKGAHSRVRSLFKPAASLPDPALWLRQLDARQFAEVSQVIRIVLALNDDDELIRDSDNRICLSVSGKLTPLEWLSEGYRSVFAMVADLLRELLSHYSILEEAEAVVLIDEIDTHLHPRWKMRIMTALRRALPRVQFIVTTHDPLCLRGMDDGEVVVLQRFADGTIARLEGLPSIHGMRADQLLTSDYFGLSSTIDPQSELDMARYVAHLGEDQHRHSEEVGRLIQTLTIGDDAQEQVIQKAMSRFIAERERPLNRLRSDISNEAVDAVLAALRGQKSE